MAKFNIDKNGYNVTEVEEYIDSLTLKYENKLSEQRDKIFALKNENNMLQSNLDDYKIKEEEMSKALLFAVEKSEQIEKSSKKVYELEIRRMRLIYAKWKEILDMINIEELILGSNNMAGLTLKEFESNINQILKQNEEYEARKVDEESIKDNLKENSSNYIKNLLNRMEYLVDSSAIKESVNDKNESAKSREKTRESLSEKRQKISQKTIKKESIDRTIPCQISEEDKKENARLLNINRRFNNISSKLGLANGTEILDSSISDDNAYFRNITNDKKEDEGGFDLDAILNPKEDLEEIMKAFEEI